MRARTSLVVTAVFKDLDFPKDVVVSEKALSLRARIFAHHHAKGFVMWGSRAGIRVGLVNLKHDVTRSFLDLWGDS